MVQLASNADATAATDLFGLLGPNRRVVVRDLPHAVHFAPHIREPRLHWRPRVCVAQLEGVEAGMQVRVAACDTNGTHEMKIKPWQIYIVFIRIKSKPHACTMLQGAGRDRGIQRA